MEGEAGYLYQLVPVQLKDLELGHPLEHSLGEGGDPVSAQSQLLYINIGNTTNFETFSINCLRAVRAVRAVDPDPHSFYLLDPDQHSMCESGRYFFQIKTEKCKEIGTSKYCKFLQIFKVNL